MNRMVWTEQGCRHYRVLLALVFAVASNVHAAGERLELPSRDPNAPDGLQFARSLVGLDLRDRDEKILRAILSGNLPNFLRELVPVNVTNLTDSTTNTATFYVMPDYLAVGSDTNYFLAPIAPETAQRIADALHCSIPTPAMVDAIYKTTAVKLEPVPLPPGPEMTDVQTFIRHSEIINTQRLQQIVSNPLGSLVAGHKKDVVISSKLDSAPGKVAIYGWHKTNGAPIQPLYLGHTSSWVDYSQCTRLVFQKMLVNGKPTTISETLRNRDLAGLLSAEGAIGNPRYSTNVLNRGAVPFTHFTSTGPFGERIVTFALDPEVRIQVNAPSEEAGTNRDVLLIIFALPNGNTIEQTVGKAASPGDDWHYNIQHIGAQTRFLRQVMPSKAIVVAYLEANQKSWPAWRKKHGDHEISKILKAVQDMIPVPRLEVVLASHSGGGSLVFGYLNAVESIPNNIVRIAFLDSDYAYEKKLAHGSKIANWLTNSAGHYLTVLAYNDAVALLDGKTFVSAAGGTWGKTHEMEADLARQFPFETSESAEFEEYFALNRRVQFLLRKNPDRKILHTVQVERNGFIHCILTGTLLENKGYAYFGAPAYAEWITGN